MIAAVLMMTGRKRCWGERSEQLQGGGREVGSLTVLEAGQLWWSDR